MLVTQGREKDIHIDQSRGKAATSGVRCCSSPGSLARAKPLFQAVFGFYAVLILRYEPARIWLATLRPTNRLTRFVSEVQSHSCGYGSMIFS